MSHTKVVKTHLPLVTLEINHIAISINV